MAAGLERNGRSRVQAIFSHAAGDNGTLLSFSEGDVITLLVPEARDGWHYGENEKNKMCADAHTCVYTRVMHACSVSTHHHVAVVLHRRGWFPFSYTRVLPDTDNEKLRVKYAFFVTYLWFYFFLMKLIEVHSSFLICV